MSAALWPPITAIVTAQNVAVTPELNKSRHAVIGKAAIIDYAPIFMTTADSTTNLVSALAPAGTKNFNPGQAAF